MLGCLRTKFQWAKAYPLLEEKYVSHSLTNLFRDVGIPTAIIPDSATSLTKGEFKKVASTAQVRIYPLEPYNPNQSTAEDMIREATRLYSEKYTQSIMGPCVYLLSRDQKPYGTRSPYSER